MSCGEMLIRAGFYAAVAHRELGDTSYALRYLGRAETLTEEGYAATDVQQRLVAAGKIAPGDDPWYKEMGGKVTFR